MAARRDERPGIHGKGPPSDQSTYGRSGSRNQTSRLVGNEYTVALPPNIPEKKMSTSQRTLEPRSSLGQNNFGKTTGGTHQQNTSWLIEANVNAEQLANQSSRSRDLDSVSSTGASHMPYHHNFPKFTVTASVKEPGVSPSLPGDQVPQTKGGTRKQEEMTWSPGNNEVAKQHSDKACALDKNTDDVIEEKVLLKKVLCKFTSMIQESKDIKQSGVSIIFKEKSENLVCILKGTSDSVRKVKAILENVSKELIKTKVNFNTGITAELRSINVEDDLNDQLKEKYPGCVVKQSHNAICLYGFDKNEVDNAKTYVCSLIVKSDHLLTGDLREKKQLLKEHFNSRFETRIAVEIDSACRLHMLGLKETIDRANKDFVDISEGRMSLCPKNALSNPKETFSSPQNKVTKSLKIQESLHFRFLEKSVLLKQVSDKYKVNLRPDQADYTISINGTSDSISRAIEDIHRIEMSLVTNCIAISDPESMKYFSSESWDRDVERFMKKFNVIIEKSFTFSCGKLEVVKEPHIDSSFWSSSQGKLLVVECFSFENVIADVKYVPTICVPGRGGRFTVKNHVHGVGPTIVEMGVPDFIESEKSVYQTVEDIAKRAIEKASDRKVKSFAFLVSPVAKWNVSDLMRCFVNSSVDWLLHSPNQTLNSILLCTEDTECFVRSDEYVDKCLQTKMQGPGNVKEQPTIQVVEGYLDQTRADVIVDTSSRDLDLSKGKVSAALLKAAGQNLQNECWKYFRHGIRHDEIAVTDGYKLNCKKVFHIALHTQHKAEDAVQSIRSAVERCLKTASDYKYTSIAFPAMGTGSLKYSIDLVASEMFMSIERFINDCLSTTLQNVLFVIHPKDANVFQTFLKMQKKLVQPTSSTTANKVYVNVRLKITGMSDNVEECQKVLRARPIKMEKDWSRDTTSDTPPIPARPRANFSWSTHTANNRQYKIGDIGVMVYEADIVNVPVECIVNAANGDLQHHGGIASVIAKAAGKSLLDECQMLVKQNGPVPVTRVVHTVAGNLPKKYVLHAVGPCFTDYRPITRSSLEKCQMDLKQTILNCLHVADGMELKSIALPSISSGIFLVPKEVCAIQYAQAVIEFSSRRSSLKDIHFVDTSPGMISIIHKTFDEMIIQRKPSPFDSSVFIEQTTETSTDENYVEKSDKVIKNTARDRPKVLAQATNNKENAESDRKDTKKDGNRETTWAIGTSPSKMKNTVDDIPAKFDTSVFIEQTTETSTTKNLAKKSDKVIKNTARDRPKALAQGANDNVKPESNVTCSYISTSAQMYCTFGKGTIAEVKVLIYKGDIINLPHITAVVCSDNRAGEGKGIVAGLLLKKGGESYRKEKELQFTRHRNYGEVITTTGGSNIYTWIIHAIVSRGDPKSIPMLYRALFQEIKTREIKSVAIPLLGTGAGSIDTRRSTEMLFNELLEFCKVKGQTTITLHVVVHDSTVADTVKDIFKKSIDGIKKKSQGFNDGSSLHSEDNKSRTDEDTTASFGESGADEDCVICMDKVTNAKRLDCGHVFCVECIDGYFRVKQACPTCGKVCGIITGDQPDGQMDITKRHSSVAGYEQYKSIAVTYRFGDGTQGPDHPRPGSPYKGIARTAYLPDNKEGREVCAMLMVAFERQLVFTIGTSRTTGKECVITWNDIHHKTDMRPNTQFGFPDKTYLQRVREELEVKGVTVQDIGKELLKDLQKDNFRETLTTETKQNNQ